ncbi:MAG TPA: hypothetical protein PKL08_05585, partial [Thermoanaerobaculaceae bacterium]|nr:hypothetical protein [Thermoanaerobaculaceae bacterium]
GICQVKYLITQIRAKNPDPRETFSKRRWIEVGGPLETASANPNQVRMEDVHVAYPVVEAVEMHYL